MDDSNRKELLGQIAKLHQTAGDARFFLAKMNLAHAAGQLDAALGVAYESEEIKAGRRKLASALKKFRTEYGQSTPLSVKLGKNADLDRFASAMIEFGMAHRVR